jgi:peptide/nickel transport system substrate-binding protein
MPVKRLRLLMLALLAAVGSAHADDSPLRVAAQTFPAQFGNPYAPIALPNAFATQAIFDPLTRMGPNGEVLPGLATGWAQETPTTWVFRLRSGVAFSNGEPFDADAVIAAFAYLQTDEGRRDSVASQDLKSTFRSFRARDALTVEVVTLDPDPILPLHLHFVRIPAPRHWARLGRDAFQLAPIGTGPFRVDRWDDARLDLSAFAQSWRAPQVTRIVMSQIADPIVRLQAFISGTVDIAAAVGPDDAEAIARVGGRLLARPSPVVHYLMFVTTAETPLKDARVQRALNHAVDKKTMVRSFLADATRPVGQFSHPMAFGFDPTLPAYDFDRDKARALLAEAGYADGFAFTMLLDTSSGGGYTDWFQQIAQDFAAVGVTMTVRPTTTARMVESVQSGTWPAEAFAWTFAGFDSLRGYRFRSCGWRAAYHCDPAMMPLIAAAQAAPSPETRRAATMAALGYERDHPPGVLLWPGVGFDAVAAHVADYAVDQDAVRWEAVRFSRDP